MLPKKLQHVHFFLMFFNCVHADYKSGDVRLPYAIIRDFTGDKTTPPLVRKCCPIGQALTYDKCKGSTVKFTLDVYEIQKFLGKASDHFNVLDGQMCTGPKFILDAKNKDDQFFLQPSGNVYMPFHRNLTASDEFCFENVIGENGGDLFTILICGEETTIKLCLSVLGMIISMPFLLVTFIVYALIPERNLPAKALMCYVLSLLFAYVFLVTIQLHSSFEPLACATVGLLCYFFFMVSFFWMNSSCIDIWLTFSGIRGLTGSKKHDTRRFLYYSAYAWGVPLLLVCLVIGLSYGSSVDGKSLYHPGIGNGQCWFGNGMPTFIYFYLPIAILLTTNIVLFCVTAYKIQMVRNDTAMLRRDDSQKSRLESDKQRFNLYVKLLLAMGINWTMEVISWALDWKFSSIPTEVWYLTDFCNALYGVFIFFIFVFKRNIWVMLKKRYLTFTGKPHLAHSLGTSTTRTTVSHVTSEA